LASRKAPERPVWELLERRGVWNDDFDSFEEMYEYHKRNVLPVPSYVSYAYIAEKWRTPEGKIETRYYDPFTGEELSTAEVSRRVAMLRELNARVILMEHQAISWREAGMWLRSYEVFTKGMSREDKRRYFRELYRKTPLV